MEENCGGGQGLNWAVQPGGVERERERENLLFKKYHLFPFQIEQNNSHGEEIFICAC
jgi:hypothetical protein